MTKVILFEPWHLGDVAVCLSTVKPFIHSDFEFILVCNKKWKDWALSTGIVKHIIEFTPPWTFRYRQNKYNPFNYSIKSFLQFKKEVLKHSPHLIIDLRGDIRANVFLKLLFNKKIKVVSSPFNSSTNVYKRDEVVKKILEITVRSGIAKDVKTCNRKDITLFFGASDFNRQVPDSVATDLITQFHEAGYHLNLILQPTDNYEVFLEKKERLKLQNLRVLQGGITEIVDVIRNTSLVISTDSGWLHVAYFYDKPVIGLFGFDTMRIWLPPGGQVVTSNTVYPDFYRYKKKHRLLQPLANISVSQVLKMVEEKNERCKSVVANS